MTSENVPLGTRELEAISHVMGALPMSVLGDWQVREQIRERLVKLYELGFRMGAAEAVKRWNLVSSDEDAEAEARTTLAEAYAAETESAEHDAAEAESYAEAMANPDDYEEVPLPGPPGWARPFVSAGHTVQRLADGSIMITLKNLRQPGMQPGDTITVTYSQNGFTVEGIPRLEPFLTEMGDLGIPISLDITESKTARWTPEQYREGDGDSGTG